MKSKIYLLKDLVEIKHGYAFPGNKFSDELSFPTLVTPGNFRIGGGFLETKPKTFSGEILEEYILQQGDLIVTMTDLSKSGDSLGYSAEVPSGKTYLHNQRIGKVLNRNPELLSLKYLNWFMRTKKYRNLIMGSSTGTTVRHTSPTRILEIEIRLPTFAIQNAVAKALDALESKIKMNGETSQTLEDIAQTVFKSWFIDFDPVKAKMVGEKPGGMDAATAALFPDSMEESELGLMPSGWELKAVGDALEVTGGTTPSTSNADYWDGEHCWTTPKDLSNQVGLVTTDSSRKITDAGLAQISSGLLPVYSVLMSCRAPIGYISVNAVPTAVNQGFIALRNSEIYPALFLTNWLESNMQEIKNRAGGATFAEISRKAFKEIGFLVPNQKVLEVYAEITVPILEQLKQMSLQNKNLNELRDSLLPRLISGELQIPDEMLAS